MYLHSFTVHLHSPISLLGTPVQSTAIQYNSSATNYTLQSSINIHEGGKILGKTFQYNTLQYTNTPHYDLNNKQKVELSPF